MDQLTWLQQSLQKPRLSAVARTLAEVFPRSEVPRVVIGTDEASKGIYNSASRKSGEHLEYPGFILRYREFNAGGNYVGYGWARPYVDHIGILGGQVTVANDGFFTGITKNVHGYDPAQNPWDLYSHLPVTGAWVSVTEDTATAGRRVIGDGVSAFASLVPALSGLLINSSAGPLTDSDGTILLTAPLTFEEPLSRGFASLQWLTESETRRA
jgi:hypothetical protein|nr:MAG TPA: hypothetical protein [Caudoviricetes sp.]